MKRLEFNKENADKYGVETRDGRAVRIFCWDLKLGNENIIAGVSEGEEEKPLLYHSDGSFLDVIESKSDLIIKLPPRWRAKKCEKYYHVYYSSTRFITVATYDFNLKPDDEHYEKGNYFETEEESQKYADYPNDCAKKFFRKKCDE